MGRGLLFGWMDRWIVVGWGMGWLGVRMGGLRMEKVRWGRTRWEEGRNHGFFFTYERRGGK